MPYSQRQRQAQPLPGQQQRHCWFCTRNFKEIDYKDSETLRRFISSYGKIVPRKRSGVCTKHQRKLATAIKRARSMALLPYTNL